jgi:hypothetical protein
MLCRILCLVFRGSSQANPKTNAQGDSQHNKHADEEAPPLELVAVFGMDNGLTDVHVPTLEVRCRLLSICLCALNERLLRDNELVHFIEEKSQLSDRALNALELVVASLDSA